MNSEIQPIQPQGSATLNTTATDMSCTGGNRLTVEVKDLYWQPVPDVDLGTKRTGGSVDIAQNSDANNADYEALKILQAERHGWRQQKAKQSEKGSEPDDI